MTEPLTVRDLGELGLLERLQVYCPREIVGDDAAVLTMPPGHQLVVTTDVLVDGVHFSDRTTDPQSVGWRSVAANLSDLAAMGAEPLGITVGLSLPGSTPVAWVEGVYEGMAACLHQFGGDIDGGDLCRSPVITIAITALGSVQPHQAFYRQGARPGQVIVATGYHGSSRAGLEILLDPLAASTLAASTQAAWIQAHRRPIPRFDAVRHLRQLLGAPPTVPAMAAMDSSDGLANAVLQLCRASGVGAEVWRSHLPIDPHLIQWQGEAKATEWALYGGEDFELVFCLEEGLGVALVEKLGQGAAIIGRVIESSEVYLTTPESTIHQPLTFSQGFQHFASNSHSNSNFF